MVSSTQAFGALAFLFLAFSIPFPGKIVLFGETSPFQRSVAVRSGNGAVVSLSSGSSRRRTKVDGAHFPFLSSGEPLEPSAFLADGSYEFTKQRQAEDDENAFEDAPSPYPFSRFMANAPDLCPVEAENIMIQAEDVDACTPVAATLMPQPYHFQKFLANAPDAHLVEAENMIQAEDMGAGTPVAATLMPQACLQASSQLTSGANQASFFMPSTVALPPEDGAVGGRAMSLPDTEGVSQVAVSNFDEWGEDRNFAPTVINLVSLSHTAGSCVHVMPRTLEDFERLPFVNFTPGFSKGSVFFSRKGSAEAEILQDRRFHYPPLPLAEKKSRSSSSSKFDEPCFWGAS